MSVNWSWKEKMGSFTLVKSNPNDTKKFIVNIYQANCLGALIYNYIDKETKKPMYQFWGYWGDKTHLKRNLGLEKGYDDEYNDPCWIGRIEVIRLNTYYPYSIEIGTLFAKAHHKVIFFYKEPKPCKKH